MNEYVFIVKHFLYKLVTHFALETIAGSVVGVSLCYTIVSLSGHEPIVCRHEHEHNAALMGASALAVITAVAFYDIEEVQTVGPGSTGEVDFFFTCLFTLILASPQ